MTGRGRYVACATYWDPIKGPDALLADLPDGCKLVSLATASNGFDRDQWVALQFPTATQAAAYQAERRKDLDDDGTDEYVQRVATREEARAVLNDWSTARYLDLGMKG